MTPSNPSYICPHCGGELPASLALMKLQSIKQPDDPSIRHIPLSRGHLAIVDASDFEMLIQHPWHVTHSYSNDKLYASRNSKKSVGRTPIKMHRFIMGLEEFDGRVVDHINGNSLDNRRSNLRICTITENANNRKPRIKQNGWKRYIRRSLSRGIGFDVWIRSEDGLRMEYVGWEESYRQAYRISCAAEMKRS